MTNWLLTSVVSCSVSQDTFIVDNGDAGIWVWCGRKSNPKEKKEAMANAAVDILWNSLIL